MQGQRVETKWGRVALVWLLVAAVSGLWLRASMVWPLGAGSFRNVTHAHSHLALLGWLFGGLFALTWRSFGGGRRLGWTLFWVQQVSLVGMLFSFPWQGYGSVSIPFSTLFIFCTYGYAAGLWGRAKALGGPAGLALRLGLVFLVVCSLGPYLLGFLMAKDLGHLHWYRNAIYFYLHFLYNGFFLWALLAWVLREVQRRAAPLRVPGWVLWGFATATCLGLFVSVLWMRPAPAFYGLAFVGAAGQLFFFCRLLAATRPAWRLLEARSRMLAGYLTLGFAFKFLAEMVGSAPQVADWAAGQHIFAVIGYLHFVMLGLFTPALLGGLFPLANWGAWAWLWGGLYAIGVAWTEFLLVGQAVWPGLAGEIPLFPALFAGYVAVVAAVAGLLGCLGRGRRSKATLAAG